MILYLVRHGQSEGNVVRTFHGQTDYPLTELGREQARQSGEKLRDIPFARCYASDLCRAWDTALACLEGRGMEPEVTPGLREQDVGDMEGLSWDEMGERYPGLREKYIEDWFNAQPPNGESGDDMTRRVGACVDAIVARGEDALLVAHFGTFACMMDHFGIIDRANINLNEWYITQGTYSAIRIEDGKAELICFNQ